MHFLLRLDRKTVVVSLIACMMVVVIASKFSSHQSTGRSAENYPAVITNKSVKEHGLYVEEMVDYFNRAFDKYVKLGKSGKGTEKDRKDAFDTGVQLHRFFIYIAANKDKPLPSRVKAKFEALENRWQVLAGGEPKREQDQGMQNFAQTILRYQNERPAANERAALELMSEIRALISSYQVDHNGRDKFLLVAKRHNLEQLLVSEGRTLSTATLQKAREIIRLVERVLD